MTLPPCRCQSSHLNRSKIPPKPLPPLSKRRTPCQKAVISIPRLPTHCAKCAKSLKPVALKTIGHFALAATPYDGWILENLSVHTVKRESTGIYRLLRKIGSTRV